MSEKRIRAGNGGLYWVKRTNGGDRVVTQATWVPFHDKVVGTSRSDSGALNIIKADSGSKVVREE